MRAKRLLLSLAASAALISAPALAQSSEQKCPVALDQVQLSYAHNGEQSKPQLRIVFGNAAGKRIANVTFTLSVLDSGGYPHPYPDDLVYGDGLEASERKNFIWTLAPDSVDIHHTGETVLLQEVEFADATTWKDDGSESCVLTVDFHPK